MYIETDGKESGSDPGVPDTWPAKGAIDIRDLVFAYRPDMEPTLDGLIWLSRNGFDLSVAARTLWGESEEAERAGFARLFAAHGIAWSTIFPPGPAERSMRRVVGSTPKPETSRRRWAKRATPRHGKA